MSEEIIIVEPPPIGPPKLCSEAIKALALIYSEETKYPKEKEWKENNERRKRVS